MKRMQMKRLVAVVLTLGISLTGCANFGFTEVRATSEHVPEESATSEWQTEMNGESEGWLTVPDISDERAKAQEILAKFQIKGTTYDIMGLVRELMYVEQEFFTAQEGFVFWGFYTPGGMYTMMLQSVLESDGQLTSLLEIAENFTAMDGTYRQWFYFAQGDELLQDATHPELIVGKDVLVTLIRTMRKEAFMNCPFEGLEVAHYCHTVEEGKEDMVYNILDDAHYD